MKEKNQNNKRNNRKALMDLSYDFHDTLDEWLVKYFDFEVSTTGESSKIKKHDISIFLEYLQNSAGSLNRNAWTHKVSRNFYQYLKTKTDVNGHLLWSDRTINRILSHLKTFSKWIHKVKPFKLFNPMLKIKRIDEAYMLNLDNSISSEERIKILASADKLNYFDAKSKDTHRFDPANAPSLKYKRPSRDRAIIYTLIETGMKRSEVLNISLSMIDFKRKIITFKGKSKHSYNISRLGIKAIKDYIANERALDAEKWQSDILFLSSKTVNRGSGKLTPCVINHIWNKICQFAGVEGKTPQASRHAMGKFIMVKTNNIAAVRKQLGHINPSFSVQYSLVSDRQIKNVLEKR
ncbi:MAG: Site-specific integrase [Ignavibacteria bacterium]|nr:Site-specific integrase [Ignavibacteria bacterium]